MIPRDEWHDPGWCPHLRIWPEKKHLTAATGPARAELRLDQAEARIAALGGRTARDGQLASILSDLRDALREVVPAHEVEVDPTELESS